MRLIGVIALVLGTIIMLASNTFGDSIAGAFMIVGGILSVLFPMRWA